VQDLTTHYQELVLDDDVAHHREVMVVLHQVRLEDGQGQLQGGGGGGQVSHTVMGDWETRNDLLENHFVFTLLWNGLFGT